MKNHKHERVESVLEKDESMHTLENKLPLDELLSKLDNDEKKTAKENELKEKEKAAKRKKAVVTAVILIIAIAAGITLTKTLKPILFPFEYDIDEMQGCNPGNTYNGSKVCILDETVYYIKTYRSELVDDDGEEIDSSHEVSLYSSDIKGKNRRQLYTSIEDVEDASLSVYDNKAYIWEMLKSEDDTVDKLKSRVSVVDLSSGELVNSFQPEIINASRVFIIGDQILYVWADWRGEDVIVHLSTSNLDGSNFRTIYESLGNFDYTWDDEKIYIAETTWNDDEIGRRVVLSMDKSGENPEVLWDEETPDNSYWSGLYLYEGQLIQTEVSLSNDEDDERSYYQLISLTLDSGAINVVNEWQQPEYWNSFCSNVYANYYYYNYYDEKMRNHQINRINLSNGKVEKYINVPDVPYMAGPSVDILLFNNCITLDMRELDFDDSGETSERNRIFLYDLNGKQYAEL